MKYTHTIILLVFFVACNKKVVKKSNWLLIKDWNELYYLFELKKSPNDLSLNDIYKNLYPGFVFTKTKIILKDKQYEYEIKVLNTFKHEDLYGDFDKYYKIYFVKAQFFGLKNTDETINNVDFTKSLKLLKLPIKNVQVDSVMLDFH